MKNTSEITLANVDTYLEEMRRLLGVVYRTMTGTEPPATNLDELIRALLCQGVTRQDIAFLICEAAPLRENENKLSLAK